MKIKWKFKFVMGGIGVVLTLIIISSFFVASFDKSSREMTQSPLVSASMDNNEHFSSKEKADIRFEGNATLKPAPVSRHAGKRAQPPPQEESKVLLTDVDEYEYEEYYGDDRIGKKNKSEAVRSPQRIRKNDGLAANAEPTKKRLTPQQRLGDQVKIKYESKERASLEFTDSLEQESDYEKTENRTKSKTVGGDFANQRESRVIARQNHDKDVRIKGSITKPKPKTKPKTNQKPSTTTATVLTQNKPSMTHVNKNPQQMLAEKFLTERQNIDGLIFQEAKGYWANTYVPSASSIRVLKTRLRHNNTASPRFAHAQINAMVRPNWQPFDAPQHAALGVFIQSDQAFMAGSTRALLQIGITGTQRKSGLRPAMNIGLVVDLRDAFQPSMQNQLITLLEAFRKARSIGDHFSLTVVGKPGGTLIAPGDFRHGPLSIAMQGLFSSNGQNSGPSLSLIDGLNAAKALVAKTDDPSAPLGTSLIILITPTAANMNTPDITLLAHKSATAGIPVSVIVIGEKVQASTLNRLVIAGQGRLHALKPSLDANTIINAELNAVSRVIARAIRLQIRLQPGVNLLNILGSSRLDTVHAARIRAAETSIDRRLARNLGIAADRGKDEDGIQIVIPAFYSGDDHVILLDVVVNNPGPIVDVNVRYKDLVFRQNAVLHDNLSLSQRTANPGPLQRNVLKNWLAQQLMLTIRTASDNLLTHNNAQSAITLLQNYRLLLAGLRQNVVQWHNDTELMRDEHLLNSYINALSQRRIKQRQYRRLLADSLKLTAFNRILPPFD